MRSPGHFEAARPPAFDILPESEPRTILLWLRRRNTSVRPPRGSRRRGRPFRVRYSGQGHLSHADQYKTDRAANEYRQSLLPALRVNAIDRICRTGYDPRLCDIDRMACFPEWPTGVAAVLEPSLQPPRTPDD